MSHSQATWVRHPKQSFSYLWYLFLRKGAKKKELSSQSFWWIIFFYDLNFTYLKKISSVVEIIHKNRRSVTVCISEKACTAPEARIALQICVCRCGCWV